MFNSQFFKKLTLLTIALAVTWSSSVVAVTCASPKKHGYLTITDSYGNLKTYHTCDGVITKSTLFTSGQVGIPNLNQYIVKIGLVIAPKPGTDAALLCINNGGNIGVGVNQIIITIPSTGLEYRKVQTLTSENLKPGNYAEVSGVHTSALEIENNYQSILNAECKKNNINWEAVDVVPFDMDIRHLRIVNGVDQTEDTPQNPQIFKHCTLPDPYSLGWHSIQTTTGTVYEFDERRYDCPDLYPQ